MVTSRNSPNRRQSIAVTNLNATSSTKGRRRAYSLVPGAALSPLSRARRSLGPRKSILKGSVNNPNSESATSSLLDDQNATQSMDITLDLTNHNNTSRKSLGRRVVFSGHSQVLLIPGIKTPPSESPSPPQAEPLSVTDENDYPDQKQPRRRSSVRNSMGQSEDMDLTSIITPAFQMKGSAILDEEFDYEEDEYDDDNMDVTQAIQGNFARKRSLSAGGRQSLFRRASEANDESISEIGDESMQSSTVSSDASCVGMEFTVPLGQSLRGPPEQDEAWLALRRMTHTGDLPPEPETSVDDGDMHLSDALARLTQARNSISLQGHEMGNDTFSSTEDSLDTDDIEDGNKTVNLSQVLGRASIAPSRPSIGYPDSNMDESEVYGSVIPQPSAPPSQPEPTSEPHRPNIFQPPTVVPKSPARATSPFSFSSRPPSPSKTNSKTLDTPSKSKPKPVFSAAFAPPVSRPSPKKPVAQPSPFKRPRSAQDDIENNSTDKPSPTKKQALGDRMFDVPGSNSEKQTTPASRPKPLSPSKKAPFQATQAAQPSQTVPSAIRRPSGYYTKRKSLAVGFASSTTDVATNKPASLDAATNQPKKKAPIGMGRSSLGSGPSDAWIRFDKEAASNIPEKAMQKTVEGLARPIDASSSPKRPSPARVLQTRIDVAAPVPPATAPESIPTINVSEYSCNTTVNMEATQQWREGVQPEGFGEDDTPVIPIAQFFAMTGIKFMDEMIAPRRSLHPSQLASREPRNITDIPLAEYVTAMAIDIPQLDLYSRVTRDLEAWIEKSKQVFIEAEEEANQVTPELFIEYTRADEEGQAELLHQLRLIQKHTRHQAKSDWYDWKLKWVEGLHVTAEDALHSLEKDAQILEGLKESVDVLLPGLEREYEQLAHELEKERAEADEIDASDQVYLNDLKGTIAEQNIVIETFKAEVIEGKEQLQSLMESKNQLITQKREAKTMIANAERLLRTRQSSTRSEVFKLKDELEALEDLHMFRITKVNSNVFEYVYASRFQVLIPCKNFIPMANKVQIGRLPKSSFRVKDDFPQLSNFFLTMAQQMFTGIDDTLTVRQIVHRLADYWSSCAQLRSQLTMLNIRYPVEISSSPSHDPAFKAMTTVMIPKLQAKVIVNFLFPFNTFAQWPASIPSLDCEVDVAYGSIDRSTILKAVMSRLSEATPSDNYACLLNACMGAQDIAINDL